MTHDTPFQEFGVSKPNRNHTMNVRELPESVKWVGQPDLPARVGTTEPTRDSHVRLNCCDPREHPGVPTLHFGESLRTLTIAQQCLTGCDLELRGMSGRWNLYRQASRNRLALPSSQKLTGASVDMTLSVVLPVHNAESTLTGQVAELLDVLADITSQFEILVVDDGSTDHTEEIAHELSQCYPQLHVVRHRHRQGVAAAVETGMSRCAGEVVVVQEGPRAISANRIHGMWSTRRGMESSLARTEMPWQTHSPHLPGRLTGRGGGRPRPPRAVAREAQR
ncbi:MAG: glycosyltransferase family 2 protein [Planctomycetes bacterium]|nr:glycosyltransferase family 2 protein [Planctomycetota bacterium]